MLLIYRDYANEIKDFDLFELRAERDKLMREIKRFEKKFEWDISEVNRMVASHEMVYWQNLQHLDICTQHLRARYDQDRQYISDAIHIVEDILASGGYDREMIGNTYTTGELYDELVYFDDEYALEDDEPYDLSLLHRYLHYVAPRNGLVLECEQTSSLTGLPYNIPFRVLRAKE